MSWWGSCPDTHNVYYTFRIYINLVDNCCDEFNVMFPPLVCSFSALMEKILTTIIVHSFCLLVKL